MKLMRGPRVDRSALVPGQACARRAVTGTRAGYMAHYYVGEGSCEACLEGHRRESAEGRTTETHLRSTLWTNYRLTLERFHALLDEQGGRCAICDSDDPGDERAGRFHVDHDHACCPGRRSCGQCIRGLLCRACNTALGNFGDDRARLLRAAEYLGRRTS